MAEFFILPILAARKSIIAVTPYFIPGQASGIRRLRKRRRKASMFDCCCRARIRTAVYRD
jgi:hypothetical protein